MIRNRRQYEATVSGDVKVLLDRGRVRAEQGRTISMAAHEQRLRRYMAQSLAEVYERAARGLLRKAKVTAPGDLDSRAMQWADDWARTLAGKLRQTSENELVPGADNEVVFGEARAKRIGVTEVTRAISAGEHEAMQIIEAAGKRYVGIWYRVVGACPVCNPLHKKPPEVWTLVAPLGPPGHPNCRCRLLWVPFEELETYESLWTPGLFIAESESVDAGLMLCI